MEVDHENLRIWEVWSFLGGLLMQFSPTLRSGARPNVGEEVYAHYGVSNRLSHPWLVYCSPPPTHTLSASSSLVSRYLEYMYSLIPSPYDAAAEAGVCIL